MLEKQSTDSNKILIGVADFEEGLIASLPYAQYLASPSYPEESFLHSILASTTRGDFLFYIILTESIQVMSVVKVIFCPKGFLLLLEYTVYFLLLCTVFELSLNLLITGDVQLVDFCRSLWVSCST